MILYISIIIVQRMNSTQRSKNLRMCCNITMYVRILITITKRLMRHATGLHNPCGRNQVIVLQKSLTTTSLASTQSLGIVSIVYLIHLSVTVPRAPWALLYASPPKLVSYHFRWQVTTALRQRTHKCDSVQLHSFVQVVVPE